MTRFSAEDLAVAEAGNLDLKQATQIPSGPSPAKPLIREGGN